MATTHANPNVGVAAAKLVTKATGTQTFNPKIRSVTLKPVLTISVGGVGVTVGAGLVVDAGATITLLTTGDLWAIAPVATTCKVVLSDAS